MKNVLRKSFIFILALIITLGNAATVPRSSAAKEVVLEYEYRVENGEAIITECKTYATVGTLTVPETLDGYTVTGIDTRAFNLVEANELVIPKTVTYMAEDALGFVKYSLHKITVDSENSAFSSDDDGVLYNKDKTLLIQFPIMQERAEYTIAESVTEIGREAFASAYIKKLTIPGNVKKIGKFAFEMGRTHNVTIGEGVEYIDDYAFYSNVLRTLSLPDTLQYIGFKAFEETPFIEEQTNFEVEDLCCYYGDYLITTTYSAGGFRELNIREGTRVVAGDVSHWFSEGVRKINIPASVESIGSGLIYSKYNDSEGTQITVDPENKYYCTDEYGVLYTKDMKELVFFVQRNGENQACYVIPQGVEVIRDFAMGSDMNTLNIYIPDSVKEIGYKAVCDGITKYINYGGTEEKWKKLTEFKDYYSHSAEYFDYYNEYEDTDTIASAIVSCNAYEAGEHKLLKTIEHPYGCTVVGGFQYICSCGFDGMREMGGGGHVYFEGDLWAILHEPTCTEKGVQYQACHKCGGPANTMEYGKPTGHKRVAETLSDGTVIYVCSVCGKNLTPIGCEHESDGEIYIKKATCTAEGRAYLRCVHCNMDFGTVYTIEALGHDTVRDVHKEASCQEEGLAILSCKRCKERLGIETTPKTDHEIESSVYSQICGQQTIKHACKNCTRVDYEKIEGDFHEMGEWVYEGGNKFSNSCKGCGKKTEERIVEITVSQDSVRLECGFDFSLAAEMSHDIGYGIVYSSSDEKIATVSPEGKITAVSKGNAVVTASIAGTDVKAQCGVEVFPKSYRVMWLVDGNTYQVDMLSEGEKIVAPDVEEKDGYRFIGWTPEVPDAMPAHTLDFTAVFEKIEETPPDIPDVPDVPDIPDVPKVYPTIGIKENIGSVTLLYGVNLVMVAEVTDMPEGASVAWYENGQKIAAGREILFPAKRTTTVIAVLVDENGKAIADENGNEISDTIDININNGFLAKFLNFFKTLFGIDKTVTLW